ncbi:MAG: rhomboid family intramembrane serine protease, partial [Thermoguttaceae bacterium]
LTSPLYPTDSFVTGATRPGLTKNSTTTGKRGHHGRIMCKSRTYYALRFPHAKVGFLFRYWFYFQWLRVPAIGALFFWFVLQLFYVYLQRQGVGNVAALAHLGGAVVGVVVWLLWGFGSKLQEE